MIRRPPRSPLFPSTPLFRSAGRGATASLAGGGGADPGGDAHRLVEPATRVRPVAGAAAVVVATQLDDALAARRSATRSVGSDRKSTRLNSSHLVISYAVFCL